MSVTAAQGFEAGGLGVRDQAGRRARPRDRHHRRPARGAGGGRVHRRTSRRAAPVQVSRAAPAERARAPRSCSAPATRTRRRGSRAAPTRAAWPSSPATGLGLRRHRRARLLDRAHRLLHADGRAGVRHPEAHRVAERRATRRPTRSSPPTPCARRPSPRSRARTRSSAGWPRARRCSRPRWPRCSRSSPPTRCSTPDPLQAALDPRGRRHVQPALRRRLHEHQRHRARPRQRRVRASRSATTGSLGAFTDALTEVCGSLAEQMARDAEGATKFARVTVRGARSVDEARPRPRAGRRLAAGPVLAERRGPLLGPRALRARRQRRDVRPGAGRDRVQRHRRLPQRHRRVRRPGRRSPRR